MKPFLTRTLSSLVGQDQGGNECFHMGRWSIQVWYLLLGACFLLFQFFMIYNLITSWISWTVAEFTLTEECRVVFLFCISKCPFSLVHCTMSFLSWQTPGWSWGVLSTVLVSWQGPSVTWWLTVTGQLHFSTHWSSTLLQRIYSFFNLVVNFLCGL